MKNKKILVAFATKLGSTEKIAQLIGDELRGTDIDVDVHQINEIDTLDDYSEIIIGGPIRYDDWIPELKEFAKTHHSVLSTLPHRAFFSCLTLTRNTNKAKKQGDEYAAKIASLFPNLWPNSIGQFTGVLDYSKFTPFSRLIAKGLFAILRVPAGDYRDEKLIRSWASEKNCG